jgi:hypothetical protein
MLKIVFLPEAVNTLSSRPILPFKNGSAIVGGFCLPTAEFAYMDMLRTSNLIRIVEAFTGRLSYFEELYCSSVLADA